MPDRRYTRWMRIRLLAVVALLGLLSAVVLVRIWTLQISQADWLKGLAEDQYLKQITLEPMRGAIVDRNGAPLAASVMTDSVFVMPTELEDPKHTARQLASALGLSAAELAKTLQRRKHFTWVKRRIPPAEAERVRALELKGVHFRRESRRYYPARELASTLVGFAGDGRGLEGLELLFDGRLRGSTVLAQGLRDAHGNVLFSEGVGAAQTPDGTRLVLALDLTIQEIVEAELERVVEQTQARRALAVVMDPSTGEVLAMANAPSFNPNTYWDYPQARYRNRAVSDCFEPGSTMKVFSLASALDQKAVEPDETFDCGSGRLQVGPHTIHDHGKPHAGRVSLREVLVESKNTCTAMIGMRLGREALYAKLRDFGFGRPTGADLPGESRCVLRKPQRWYDVDLATISFGQGVSVNALQLTTALCAVANGGVWMRPLVIREIRSADDRAVQRFEPEPAGRVIEQRTAGLLRDMMIGVTEPGGTGTRAAIPGFDVAGKTGTAEKPDLIAGGYSKEKRVASFMGFVPARQPRIAALVVVDEPKTSPYGGVVAAPVFARIAEATLAYLGEFPDGNRPGRGGDAVAARAQAPVSEAVEGSDIDVAITGSEEPGGPSDATRLPDLRGRSARAALRTLSARGLEVVLVGTGRVTSQRPAAGVRVKAPARVTLILQDPGAGAELAAGERGTTGAGGRGSGHAPQTPGPAGGRLAIR